MPNLSLIDSARVLVTHLRMRTLQAASRAVLEAAGAELRRITQDSQPGSKRVISIRETRFHMDRAALAALAETCAKAVMASGDPEALARMKAYSQQVTAMGEYQPAKRAPSKRRTTGTATREARSIAVPAMAYPRASGPCHRPEADGNDMPGTRMLRSIAAATPEQPQARSIAVPAMAYPRASGPCHRPEADGNDMPGTGMLRSILRDACHWRSPEVSARLAA